MDAGLASLVLLLTLRAMHPANPGPPLPSPQPHPPGGDAPSPWVQRWIHLIAPGGEVLDLACGHGRHMRHLAEHGFRPLGVDQNPEALAHAQAWGKTCLADVENLAWPFPCRVFDAVIITNYLWRPLLPQILASLAPKGVLIHETFAQGNETVVGHRGLIFCCATANCCRCAQACTSWLTKMVLSTAQPALFKGWWPCKQGPTTATLCVTRSR